MECICNKTNLCTGDNLEQLLDVTNDELKKGKFWFDQNKQYGECNNEHLGVFIMLVIWTIQIIYF